MMGGVGEEGRRRDLLEGGSSSSSITICVGIGG